MTDSTAAVLAWLQEYRGPGLPPFVNGYLREHRDLEKRVADLEATVAWFQTGHWACIACGHRNRGPACAHCGRILGAVS